MRNIARPASAQAGYKNKSFNLNFGVLIFQLIFSKHLKGERIICGE